MANIPIKKLKEGSTSYYPLSVGESVVTTKDITVASDIGGYRKNDKINKVSNLDVILNKLLGEPAAAPVVDTALSNTSTNAVQNKVIKAAIDKKVEETIGESKVWNEASGGGAMYTSASTGIKSFVGVNNPASTGGIAGIAGQLYVIKGDEKTKLNMYNGKFCYVKGNNPTTDDEKAKRELVVQEDLNATKLIEIVEGMTAAQKTKFKEALGL